MRYSGRLDIEKYRKVTDKMILTDDGIITENHIQHIIERRGRDFYNKYAGKFPEIIEGPDYIFKDKSADTSIVYKTFIEDNGSSVNVVIRLAVEGDDSVYKNSVITVMIKQQTICPKAEK